MQQGQSPTPKIRIEKRRGKTMTVIAGLHTYGEMRLKKIAGTFKTMFGAGGAVKNGVIEIQGNHIDAIKDWFKENK
ncbi:MAG: translation initiation factor 1 [Candidatus Omnitrophota bacterium]|jgi:translation initiation factor 1